MENEELEMNVLDMLFDEENEDDITIYDEDGNPVAFEQIALIPWNGSIYAILKPVEPVDGMADDEALVFVIVEEDGEEVLAIVEDETAIDAVFDEYYKLLAEQTGE